ncbi:MAG: hypothetical protein AAGG48_14415 [Planctomycetota bacterium]
MLVPGSKLRIEFSFGAFLSLIPSLFDFRFKLAFNYCVTLLAASDRKDRDAGNETRSKEFSTNVHEKIILENTVKPLTLKETHRSSTP